MRVRRVCGWSVENRAPRSPDLNSVQDAYQGLPVATDGMGDTPLADVSSFPAPAYFRIRDVLRITALSRPTLYRRIAARRFPPPVHLGGRACGWASAALKVWIADPDGYRTPTADEIAGCRKRGRPRKYP